jgi:hypothetical protein
MPAAITPRPGLEPPADLSLSPRVLVGQLAEAIGNESAAHVCIELLSGADPRGFRVELDYLGGRPGQAVFEGNWPDLWARTWGARGLRYVWVEEAVSAITAGLGDEHWRPAEMCLKVAALREVGTAGDGAVLLLADDLPRVRGNAVRTLGFVGDTEHVEAVERMLDDPVVEVRRQAFRALERLRERLDLIE